MNGMNESSAQCRGDAHTHVTHVDNLLFFLSLTTCSVQETDGSYFESFTALAWKRENRRMSAVRTAETRAETLPENERDPQADEEIADSPEEKEQLYLDVLYTIANSVGAPPPGGQVILAFATGAQESPIAINNSIYVISVCPLQRGDVFAGATCIWRFHRSTLSSIARGCRGETKDHRPNRIGARSGRTRGQRCKR